MDYSSLTSVQTNKNCCWRIGIYYCKNSTSVAFCSNRRRPGVGSLPEQAAQQPHTKVQVYGLLFSYLPSDQTNKQKAVAGGLAYIIVKTLQV